MFTALTILALTTLATAALIEAVDHLTGYQVWWSAIVTGPALTLAATITAANPTTITSLTTTAVAATCALLLAAEAITPPASPLGLSLA